MIHQPKSNYAYTTQNLRACCGHKKHTPHRLLFKKSARAALKKSARDDMYSCFLLSDVDSLISAFGWSMWWRSPQHARFSLK